VRRNTIVANMARLLIRCSSARSTRRGRPRSRRSPRSCPAVPLNGPAEARFEIGRRAEPELRRGALGVELPARLAVRLTGVPDDAPLESDLVRDPFDELPDRDLEARPQVHRQALVETLRRHHDPLRRIVNVEELAGGTPIAPHDDLGSRRI